MSFVFYDTETTGLDRNFDQILHFGAIKTDWQLEVVERFEIRCRLLPHIVPHPVALCTTGTPVEALLDVRLPSYYEMVCAIVAKLAEWSPATFVGYYSLGFDEHLLRSAFYQCLHYPYLTSSRPNSRADALTILHAAAALAPDVLSIPRTPDGRPSFTLAGVAAENGLTHVKAHDALADAEATLQICRRLAQGAPTLWSNALRFSQKPAVTDFLDSEEAFILTQTYFGEPRHFCVTKVGADPTDPNALFVVDLSADMEDLAGLPDADLAERLAATPKIVRSIRANASPTLSLLDDWDSFAGMPAEHWRERATALRADPALCARLVSVRVASRAPWPTSPHVEARMFERPFPSEDGPLLRQFHAAPWSERWEIVRRLRDPRFRQLGARLVFFESPDAMPESDRRRFEVALADRFLGDAEKDHPWLTPRQAQSEIDRLMPAAGQLEQGILRGLSAHLSTYGEAMGA
jgi:exodeoxyribonuclease-1